MADPNLERIGNGRLQRGLVGTKIGSSHERSHIMFAAYRHCGCCRMFQPMIAGLREQIKVFGAQKTIFDAQMQLAAKELEAERGRQDSLARQINDLKVEVTAGAGIDALTARVAGLETSLNELATANNAVRSAFGVVVGTLAATELSDSFSNTPLALRAAQAEIINKWWK
jgi:hypothetical protein